MRSETLKK